MNAETYICTMTDGSFEFGYTFKAHAGDVDSEFDIALGRTTDPKTIIAALEAFKPKAEKIAAALS